MHGCPQKYFQGGNVDISLIIFKVRTNERSQNGFLILHHKVNAPYYGNNHKKCASLAAISWNITIISTVGYLQIFNAAILRWSSTKSQITTLSYLASRAVPR